MEYNLQKTPQKQKQKTNHYAIHPKLTQYCKSTILKLKKKSQGLPWWHSV